MQIPERGPKPSPLARRSVLALLLLAAGVALFVFRQQDTTSKPVLPADWQRLEPQLREYISRAAQEVRKQPDNYQAQVNLALIYAANGLWPEARIAFARLVQLNTNEP